MDTALSALLGIALGTGLAAATGLRIFLPLLIAGLAARAGWIPLNDSFAWLAGTGALIAFGSAAIIETVAYYVPGVDHMLDVLSTPAAAIAGTLVSAAAMTDLPPGILWPLAIVAGGGVAGLTRGGTAVLRAKSGLATAGIANPVVSTFENFGAATIAVLSIALPLFTLAIVMALALWLVRRILRARRAGR